MQKTIKNDKKFYIGSSIQHFVDRAKIIIFNKQFSETNSNLSCPGKDRYRSAAETKKTVLVQILVLKSRIRRWIICHSEQKLFLAFLFHSRRKKKNGEMDLYRWLQNNKKWEWDAMLNPQTLKFWMLKPCCIPQWDSPPQALRHREHHYRQSGKVRLCKVRLGLQRGQNPQGMGES